MTQDTNQKVKLIRGPGSVQPCPARERVSTRVVSQRVPVLHQELGFPSVCPCPPWCQDCRWPFAAYPAGNPTKGSAGGLGGFPWLGGFT